MERAKRKIKNMGKYSNIKDVCKKLIVLKTEGNVTALIYGVMFMTLMLVWCMFSFRMNMLNATFDYIDDAMTTSLLGAALVNTEEYGKSNQLIIHNNEEYTNGTWTACEQAILLSELNYGSDILLKSGSLEPKQVLSNTSRLKGTADYNDNYLLQSASALIGNMNYNLSNGNKTSTINVNNRFSTVSSGGAIDSEFKISSDVLDKSFLGSYIIDNSGKKVGVRMEITRFDIVTVYRMNLAEKHTYMSEYLNYNTDSYGDKTVTGFKGGEPTTSSEFDNKYKPLKFVLKDGVSRTIDHNEAWYETQAKKDSSGDLIENTSYASEYTRYLQKKIKWETDINYFQSYCGFSGGSFSNPNNLYCYTNTHTTFQGTYDANKDKIPYHYFFSHDGGIVASDASGTNKADTITSITSATGGVAPIVGYSHYIYNKNSSGGFANGTQFTYKNYADSSTKQKTTKITIGSGEKKYEVENTSLYMELSFNIKSFPGKLGDSMWGKVPVTLSRLIDIKLNDG